MSQAPIPVNIITGFLGVGKTTTIRHLLAHKPEGERWAVLVNEFGDIGIDGALLSQDGVDVKEVPGGCMCCVNGLPMQIGLNKLLKERPDRLLIEPSGLGHPDEIISILRGDFYHSVLQLQATLTLVDPRKLDQPKYLENDMFNTQARVADVLIGNKTDLCNAEELARFQSWAQKLPARTNVPRLLKQVSQGEVSPDWLDLEATAPADAAHEKLLHQASNESALPTFDLAGLMTANAQRDQWLRKAKSANGYHACGWVLPENSCVDLMALLTLVHQLGNARIKAVLQTQDGWAAVNMDEGVFNTYSLADGDSSRIEIITQESLDWEALEQQLKQTLISRS